MNDSELEKVRKISNRLGLINSMLLAEDGFNKDELISLLGTVGKINLEAIDFIDELAPELFSHKNGGQGDSMLEKLDDALSIAEAMWVLLHVPEHKLDRDRLTKGVEQIMNILDEFVPRPLPPRFKNSSTDED